MKKTALVCAIVLAAGLAFAAATFLPAQMPFGYIAPAALSERDVTTGATAFVPKFEFGNYWGDIVAATVQSNGELDLLAPKWRAATQLAAQDWDDDRFIVTLHTDGYPVPFRKGDLDGDQVDLLKKDEDKRIKFLRGDRAEEGDKFRTREAILGDIIHSNPLYVSKPPRTYGFDDHADYVASHATRAGRVYVGANDGMLHAFDAATGNETFAYVPSMLLGKLKAYTEEGYVHDYYVDGPLSVGDAYFDDAWATVLIGALGAGGKGLFALDVSSADVITNESALPSGAGSRAMWEFTPASPGGANLGYTYARAAIVKLNNGKWGAVIGNGYLSENGAASLLILDISDGSVMRELVVPDAAGNGLSTPALIDKDSDSIADFAYAGDLNGNVWRFDLSGTLASQWQVGFNSKPLFSARDASDVAQPITSAVDVSRHPVNGVLVHFATGRLLSDADGDDYQEQAVYGIWDNNWPTADIPVNSDDLVQQSMTTEIFAGGRLVRTATDNQPSWSAHKGWRLSLAADGGSGGERVIQDISLSNGRVNVSSINATVSSGENWLLQINAITGGAPASVVFDLNSDGYFDANDNVDGDDNGDITGDPVDRVMGIYKGFGLVSRLTEAQTAGGNDAAITNLLAGVNPIHDDIPAEPDPDDPTPGDDDYGLAGGHMDLDVSSQTYPIGDAETDKHVHEWDNDWGAIVDFFEIDTMGGFRSVDQASDQPGSSPALPFIINIANAGLSPGAVLEINGVDFPVIEWQAKVKRFLTDTMGSDEWFPVFKLDPPTAAETAKGILQLTALKMKFASNVITLGGLHPTATGCVKGNDPSPNGEYRNGALTTQLLDATGVFYAGGSANPASVVHDAPGSRYYAGSFAIHDTLNYAVPPIGETNGPDDGLLWESTLFWHWGGGCYTPDKIVEYRDNYYDEVGTEDDRTHDGVPTGDYDDPFDDPDTDTDTDPDPDTDPGTSGTDTVREEDTEHTTATEQVSSVATGGRLFWREWTPDND